MSVSHVSSCEKPPKHIDSGYFHYKAKEDNEMDIEQHVKTDLSTHLEKAIDRDVEKINGTCNARARFENDSNEKMQNNRGTALVSNPKPVVVEGKKYCPECWNNNIESELRGSRQFLCKEHYSKFRRKREGNRLKLKRKGYDVTKKDGEYCNVKTIKVKEYNTKLGTSDFGSSLTKNKQKKPDFEKEKEFVRNELNRIKIGETIGDHANRKVGYNDHTHFFEERERLLGPDNLAYMKDFRGYVQYGSDGVKSDEWAVDSEESKERRIKSLKEIYKDWKY